MSAAPTMPSTDPLVVSTQDGANWVRRALTRDGRGLYALAGSAAGTPTDVLATIRELAEHGLRGMADALPMPIGRELTEVEQLQAQVAALLAERHSTNESVDDAAKALRADRDRIARLESAAVEARDALAALCFDLDDPGTAALGALYLLQQATVGAPMTAGETAPTVYRASHDAIVMDLYLTADAAREHCETLMRREQPDADLDWYADTTEGDNDLAPEGLFMVVAGEESDTGYVVTPLTVAMAFDPDADE